MKKSYFLRSAALIIAISISQLAIAGIYVAQSQTPSRMPVAKTTPTTKTMRVTRVTPTTTKTTRATKVTPTAAKKIRTVKVTPTTSRAFTIKKMPIAKKMPTAKMRYKPVKRFSATVRNGSLKLNLVRIVKKAGWKHVIWNIPNDYNWFGTATIKGADLTDVLSQLLKDYPVQAVFYQANRVVVIRPRNQA